MSWKRMKLDSRDSISVLPDCLLCHILSYVSTKESASTSILAKRWRYLFTLTPNLDFDDSMYLVNKKKASFPWIIEKKKKIPKSFVRFVDRALVMQKIVPLNKFSLKCKDTVHPAIVIGWLLKMLGFGVLDIDLQISTQWEYPLPTELFANENLVKLRLAIDELYIENEVSLPKVKSLCLDFVITKNSEFAKLLSGCHVLEELVLNNLIWEFGGFFSVSSETIKKLVFRRRMMMAFEVNPMQVAFDTPNVLYLEYSDNIAVEYPKVEFPSLVEASLDIKMTHEQIEKAKFSNDDRSPPEEMVGDATSFLVGICNVKILYLSENTLEVLTYCCNPVPMFNNLIHLTIKTDPDVSWRSLSALLKNCPNLETLVFEGLHHRFDNCTEEDGCLCKLWEDEDIPTSLSSSPVKVLKVLKFGEIFGGENNTQEQIKQVEHFLEKMPKLEQVILYYDDECVDVDVIHVSAQLQLNPIVASSKCKIQVISDNLCLSSIVPSPVATKWGVPM